MNIQEFTIIGLLLLIGWVFSMAAHIDRAIGEGSIAKSIAKRFSEFVINPSFSRAYNWAIEIVEQIYGPRLFSLRALSMSFVMSGFWMASILLVIYLFEGGEAWFFREPFLGLVAHKYWWFFMVTMLIDFFSLCMTRVLLPIAISSTARVKLCILFIDIFLSMLVFYGAFEVLKFVCLHTTPDDNFFATIRSWVQSMPSLILNLQAMNDITLIPDGMGNFQMKDGNLEVVYAFPEGLAFASSMLTSIWVLMHILTFYLLRLAFKVDGLKQFCLRQTKIDSNPFTAMTFTMVVILSIPAFVFLLFFSLLVRVVIMGIMTPFLVISRFLTNTSRKTIKINICPLK